MPQAEREVISESLHDKLKQYYPESRALDIDRQFTAQTVIDPRKPTDLKRWVKEKSRIDAKGFDTKAEREQSVSRIVNRMTRQDDLYIADHEEDGHAADKFVEKGKIGRRVDARKAEIKDFVSMKQVMDDVFRSEHMDGFVQELEPQDYDSLFRHPQIQDYIRNNTQGLLIQYVMRKYKVEQNKATAVVNRLSDRQRNNLFVTVKSARQPTIPTPKSRQVSVRPQARWSEQETQFLRANRRMATDRLIDAYKQSFRTSRRSDASIRNRIYKVRK